MLDIARKCYPKTVRFNFYYCQLNDHSIESAVTTLIKMASILHSSISIGHFELFLGDHDITYNSVRSLAKVMTLTNVNLIGLGLVLQFGFPTLKLLIETLPRSKITRLGLCGSHLDLTMTSRHVYHLILLIHQARYLKEVNLSGNVKLAECVPLLLIAASNIKILCFGDMVGDQQLLEMGPILQSNTTLKCLSIPSKFLRNSYSLESLYKFIKTIAAPKSISQLQHIVTNYDVNRELKTILNDFSESRGYALMLSSNHEHDEQWEMGQKNICSLPESLITGRS